jgi:hypothetical protein
MPIISLAVVATVGVNTVAILMHPFPKVASTLLAAEGLGGDSYERMKFIGLVSV